MTYAENDVFALPQGLALAPVQSGWTVEDELTARGLTPHSAALKMRVPANRLGHIIAGERGVTADTALSLARLFGTSAQFWMNLQSHYELAVAERGNGARIVAEVEAA